MPWRIQDKAKISTGEAIRDGSGTYGCPICWNINRGWENKHRIAVYDPVCPICGVELEWEEYGK
jgi:hypothetical protein